MTKEELMQEVGEFTWLWGQEFFIETAKGNFIWNDPDYNGDNTIRPYSGSFTQFLKEIGLNFGRSKGTHFIQDYCGSEFTLVEGPNK